MYQAPRLPFVASICLAGWFIVACGTNNPSVVFQTVTVEMSSTGPGAVEATDPDDGRVVSCRGLTILLGLPCDFTFNDAGLGGTVAMTAIPDSGAMLQSWTTGCPGSTALTCVVSFSGGADTTIAAQAAFVAAPSTIVFQDDFASGCSQWTSRATVNGPGSTSEACQATGGSDGGQFREMTHQLTAPGNLTVQHTFTGGSVTIGDGGGSET